LKQHSLIRTLLGLKGNPRGCVYAEPLWGIPYNLYAPYASVFMIALGLADRQIGLIISLSWFVQIIMSAASGAITDKLGRRWTTLVFDLVAWSLPALLSAIAQSFWIFLAAGLVNGVWRITQNSWSCLLVEDADKDELAGIYSWIYIANIVAGFAAPIAGFFIGKYSLVSAVRGLYFFAALMFTVKALVTFFLTAETERGAIRRRETRRQSILDIIGGYGPVLKEIARKKETLYAAGILAVVSITTMITGSFWSILATEKLGIPAKELALFPFIKSAVTMILFFTVAPALAKLRFRLPMALGFLGFATSQALLALAPKGSYAILVASAVIEAASVATTSPLVDRLVALSIDPAERARIQSILYVSVILVSSPFGWIAGELSQLGKGYPFVLSMTLYGLGGVLALGAGKDRER
jgi:MFS family permease